MALLFYIYRAWINCGCDNYLALYPCFLNNNITPRFPDGLTQLTGLGQFRGSNGRIVRERSFVVVLLYSLQAANTSQRIETIRNEYKREFRQESVLRVDSRDRVSF